MIKLSSWKPFSALLIPFIGLMIFFYTKYKLSPVKYYSPPAAQEYMKGVTVHQFANTGQLSSTMTSKYWAYLPEKALSQLEQPTLTMVSKTDSMWTVQSQFGHAHHPSIDDKISHIDLWDQVEIDHPHESPVHMTTEALTYHPNKAFVETTFPVKMYKPGLTITGEGLNGYLESNWVELLNNVETIYEPAKS